MLKGYIVLHVPKRKIHNLCCKVKICLIWCSQRKCDNIPLYEFQVLAPSSSSFPSFHPSIFWCVDILICMCMHYVSVSQGSGTKAAAVWGVHKRGGQQGMLPAAPGRLAGWRGHRPHPHPPQTLALPGQPTGKTSQSHHHTLKKTLHFQHQILDFIRTAWWFSSV